MYIYMYIYIEREKEEVREDGMGRESSRNRKYCKEE